MRSKLPVLMNSVPSTSKPRLEKIRDREADAHQAEEHRDVAEAPAVDGAEPAKQCPDRDQVENRRHELSDGEQRRASRILHLRADTRGHVAAQADEGRSSSAALHVESLHDAVASTSRPPATSNSVQNI